MLALLLDKYKFMGYIKEKLLDVVYMIPSREKYLSQNMLYF